ncbi:G patch domain-containing protein 4 [Pogonomyrmex barbatus]|uniref:G patch domain-containing protein 4 n=1 Tax=Pogonomyrmex barbatus TaxID=144034 RepID=A0A6I9VSL5_9HYME|nr:G patch domain-containing protein 4 [Pogonomyrmex barbatus]
MSDFAKAQLTKYGWTEGKGLGKDENGITESIRITANQNNAGIGYRETSMQDFWWVKLYDDAAKGVESRGNQISLTKDKEQTEQHYELYSKFIKELNNELSPSVQPHDSMELSDPIKKWIPLTPPSGKLKRIAKHDHSFFETGSMSKLNTNPNRKNMAHRKINIESDTEESEREDNIFIPTLQDNFCTTKSIKKRHKKKMNKLTLQLGICSLEENNVKLTDSLNNKKLCQKIKSEEKRTDSNAPTDSSKKGKNNINIQMVPKNNLTREVFEERYLKRLQILLDIAQKTIAKQPRKFFRPWKGIKNKKDDIEAYDILDSSTRLENIKTKRGRRKNHQKSPSFPICEEDKATETKEDSNCEVKVSIGVSNDLSESQNLYSDIQNVSELRNMSKEVDDLFYSKQKNSLALIKHVPKTETRYQSYIHRLNEKIVKKKIQRHSRNMKKFVNKLKSEALAQELNTVIKDLTEFGLTEKVEANVFKKKSTQTHLTPV